jgi:hypothetical protein
MNPKCPKRERCLKAIIRDNLIHKVDAELREQFGELYHEISRKCIYHRIASRTGYCTKVIANTLNHTTFREYSDFGE